MRSIFRHRSPAPIQTRNYSRFRPYIREDFAECCAYCLLHERLAGGQEHFELDHFRPKSDPRFQHLEGDYSNLYYSCRACNNTKRAAWPKPELEAKGYRFVDPCQEVFSDHFVDNDGVWTPRTPAGMYSEERLRLNRSQLVFIRKMLLFLSKCYGVTVDWDRPLGPQIIHVLDAIAGLADRN